MFAVHHPGVFQETSKMSEFSAGDFLFSLLVFAVILGILCLVRSGRSKGL